MFPGVGMGQNLAVCKIGETGMKDTVLLSL